MHKCHLIERIQTAKRINLVNIQGNFIQYVDISFRHKNNNRI